MITKTFFLKILIGLNGTLSQSAETEDVVYCPCSYTTVCTNKFGEKMDKCPRDHHDDKCPVNHTLYSAGNEFHEGN